MNDSYLLPVFEKALKDKQAPKDVIENYKRLYLSSVGDKLPCPLCYAFHNKRSHLIALPLPGDDKVSLVKCSVCKEEFYVPFP
jgi:hypothetical protein